MSKRQIAYSLMASILLVLFVVTQFQILPDRRPAGGIEDILDLPLRDDLNLVFILIDTLRADRLSIHGYERETSPMIDHLARTGIRFARNHSQSSWTKTSMASIWTAMYPHRTGILRYDHAIPDAAMLPAEILREEGFHTAGIWRNGWVAPTFGFQQGFEFYHRPGTGQPIHSQRRDSDSPYAIGGSDLDATDSVVEFLRANGQNQFFLYIHYMDPHQYSSDKESARFGTTYSDLYDNAIHWTDRQVAAVVSALEERSLRDETIIIIGSDHGEAFSEHGREGHGRDLHKEVTHVPWIISFPFSLEPGIVVESISENVDIWPTIFDLLGQPELESADGRSRLPEILAAAGQPAPDGKIPEETPLFAMLDRSWGKAVLKSDQILALTLPDQRYLRALEPGTAGALRSRLYATDRDPLERIDLIGQSPGVVETGALDDIIEAVLERPGPLWLENVGRVELSDLQKGQLKAIGYAID